MNVEIGTETPIFLFWEYLFRNIGILSLQCGLWITGCFSFISSELINWEKLKRKCSLSHFLVNM
jgi:hypothetical protein